MVVISEHDHKNLYALIILSQLLVIRQRLDKPGSLHDPG